MKYWHAHLPLKENKDTEKLSNVPQARPGHEQRSG